MTGRRRHSRFLLAAPVEGSLRVREEVAIEAWGDGVVDVVSMVPCAPGERLALEVPGDVGALAVTVQESRPVVWKDGAVRYRLRMLFAQPANSTAFGQGTHRS